MVLIKYYESQALVQLVLSHIVICIANYSSKYQKNKNAESDIHKSQLERNFRYYI